MHLNVIPSGMQVVPFSQGSDEQGSNTVSQKSPVNPSIHAHLKFN